jgi:hypothetical protein
VVDLPVPRSPIIITPPILGSITFRIRDSFISSWPTMAVKGKMGRAAAACEVARAREKNVQLSLPAHSQASRIAP